MTAAAARRLSQGTRLCACLLAMACSEGRTTIGRFIGDAAAPGMTCAATRLPDGGALSALPLPVASLAQLPPDFTELGRRFVRDWASDFDDEPAGWTRGSGAYSASDSEFGRDTVFVRDGQLHLQLRAKDSAEDGFTDRAHWGGAFRGPASHGHGLFLARIAAGLAERVVLSFFVTQDSLDAAGAIRGWTGGLFTYSQRAQPLETIFHDDASGVHHTERVPLALDAAMPHMLGILSLPGQLVFYVDGLPVGQMEGTEPARPWAFQFTYWILKDEAMAFDATTLPLTSRVDFVAHYALEACR